MAKSYLKVGDYNAVCDVCGGEFKASQLKKRWDGLMVCWQDWEARHPMDFLRSQVPSKPIKLARPEPTDQFTTVNYISNYTSTIPPGTFDSPENYVISGFIENQSNYILGDA